jgi:hypothetical protein
VDDLVKKHVDEGLSKAVLYDAITLRIESTIQKMQEQLDELVVRSEEQAHEDFFKRVEMTQKVQRIWQYADWEAQGYLLEDSVSSSNFGTRSVETDEGSRLSTVESLTDIEDTSAGRCSRLPYYKDSSEMRLTDIYSGALTRIQSRMDPSLFMGFAARGLVASRAKLDERLEGLSQKYWEQMSALARTAWHTC